MEFRKIHWDLGQYKITSQPLKCVLSPFCIQIFSYRASIEGVLCHILNQTLHIFWLISQKLFSCSFYRVIVTAVLQGSLWSESFLFFGVEVSVLYCTIVYHPSKITYHHYDAAVEAIEGSFLYFRKYFQEFEARKCFESWKEKSRVRFISLVFVKSLCKCIFHSMHKILMTYTS